MPDKGVEPLVLMHTGLNRASMPIRVIRHLAGKVRLELTTHGLTVRRSDQLSYIPIFGVNGRIRTDEANAQ